MDLHVHSRFSRATSKDLNFPEMYYWAKMKGIEVLGTGDFTHPKWYEEMQEQLEEVEGGVYGLKEEWAKEQDAKLPGTVRARQMRFIPTVEISNIYRRHDKVRRLHNVIVAPSLEVVAKINNKLDRIGNLHSDGRPILGLDSEELLKLVKDVDARVVFIPAHIWTPWFAMFGSKSGFDSIEEAFGEHAKYIKAVETGLSADPEMCRRVKDLDKVSLVSNSDAHSCAKLGREATVVECPLSYSEIMESIESGDDRLVGTIEFYPEEGKYHADGHRNCEVRLTPEETKKHKGLCPKCGEPLTVGVLYRVEELAQKHGVETMGVESGKKGQKDVKYIVPLPEVIAEIEGTKSTKSQKVMNAYMEAVGKLGSDFEILTEVPVEKIRAAGFEKLALAIEKMRRGDLNIVPGYDGEFGIVKIFKEGELREEKEARGQVGLW